MWNTGELAPPSFAARVTPQNRVNASAAMGETRMGSMVEEARNGVKSQSPLMLLLSALIFSRPSNPFVLTDCYGRAHPLRKATSSCCMSLGSAAVHVIRVSALAG